MSSNTNRQIGLIVIGILCILNALYSLLFPEDLWDKITTLLYICLGIGLILNNATAKKIAVWVLLFSSLMIGYGFYMEQTMIKYYKSEIQNFNPENYKIKQEDELKSLKDFYTVFNDDIPKDQLIELSKSPEQYILEMENNLREATKRRAILLLSLILYLGMFGYLKLY